MDLQTHSLLLLLGFVEVQCFGAGKILSFDTFPQISCQLSILVKNHFLVNITKFGTCKDKSLLFIVGMEFFFHVVFEHFE